MADLSFPLPASREATWAPALVLGVGALLAALLGATQTSVTIDCTRPFDPALPARCVGREQTWLEARSPVTFDPARVSATLEPRHRNRYLVLRAPEGPLPLAQDLLGADAVAFQRALDAFASSSDTSLHLRGGFSTRPLLFILPALMLLLTLPGLFQRGRVDIERRPDALWVRRARQLGATTEASLPLAPGETPRLDITHVGRRTNGLAQLWGLTDERRILLIDLAPRDLLEDVVRQIKDLCQQPGAPR